MYPTTEPTAPVSGSRVFFPLSPRYFLACALLAANRRRSVVIGMDVEAVVTKREFQVETHEAGRKKVAVTAVPTGARLNPRLSSDDIRLKYAVARLNKENPEAPIVLEELTEQQRATLVQEEKARMRKIEQEITKQRLAEVLAEEAERARAPPSPPPEEVPDEDQWQDRYDGIRDNLVKRKKDREKNFCFEGTTRIPAMCFTDNPMPDHTNHRTTVQFFTVKVEGIDGGLAWPLDVFGLIAVHDKLDYSRNIIFSRARDNPQTLTKKNPYFTLTGPSRAVVYDTRVYLETVLKVKGATESEDKHLSLLLDRFRCCEKINLCKSEEDCMFDSCVSTCLYTSMHSTLEFTCGLVMCSVEATITLQIVKRSWPDGSRGLFTAYIGSVGHMKILLLDSEKEIVPVVAKTDGMVKLSRRVVSVERFGQLVIHAVACRGGNQDQVLTENKVSFAPLDSGRSHGKLDLGVCMFDVTVAWSRILQQHAVGLCL
uniref:Uncharacterized protein n=1 Tax=Avena sativa TaxID=4498 RepID=A0ACD5Y3V7_AVESA